MMPKRMHFYWGNETMSFLRCMSVYSFAKMNPDWKTVLIRRRKPSSTNDLGWKECPDFLYFKGEDCTDMFGNLNITVRYIEDDYPTLAEPIIPELHVGDQLQWWVMSEIGGGFSDTDILYFKPIDHKRFKDTDIGLVRFLGNPEPGYIPTTFMMGQPNPFFRKMCDDAITYGDYTRWEGCGTDIIRRSFKNINDISKTYPNLKVDRLPSRIVFPFAETEKMFVQYASLMFCNNVKMPDESIGIHWYGSSPTVQQFNNKITRDNYKKFDCTICKLIGDVL